MVSDLYNFNILTEKRLQYESIRIIPPKESREGKASRGPRLPSDRRRLLPTGRPF